jgi:hypothetical protein
MLLFDDASDLHARQMSTDRATPHGSRRNQMREVEVRNPLLENKTERSCEAELFDRRSCSLGA